MGAEGAGDAAQQVADRLQGLAAPARRERASMRDFAGEMGMEYGVVMAHVSRHPDFVEGVRALLVDKDNAPRWQPAAPEGVTDAMIDALFAPLPAGRRPGRRCRWRATSDRQPRLEAPRERARARRARRRLVPGRRERRGGDAGRRARRRRASPSIRPRRRGRWPISPIQLWSNPAGRAAGEPGGRVRMDGAVGPAARRAAGAGSSR